MTRDDDALMDLDTINNYLGEDTVSDAQDDAELADTETNDSETDDVGMDDSETADAETEDEVETCEGVGPSYVDAKNNQNKKCLEKKTGRRLIG